MTPEEFRDRAAVALAPLDVHPDAYVWLTGNVARRRGRTRRAALAAGLAALVVAGTAYAVVARTVAAPPAGTVGTGDVDGDGRRDTARIVYGRNDQDRAWGVRVRMTSFGEQTVWRDGPVAGDEPRITGVVDVDLDGRAEVVVRSGTTANAREFVLLAVARSGGPDPLDWVRLTKGGVAVLRIGLTVPNLHITAGWNCGEYGEYGDADPKYPGRELYTFEYVPSERRLVGGRSYYRLASGVLYKVNDLSESWDSAADLPPEYSMQPKDLLCGAYGP